METFDANYWITITEVALNRVGRVFSTLDTPAVRLSDFQFCNSRVPVNNAINLLPTFLMRETMFKNKLCAAGLIFK